MPILITVEDGTGVADANSYVTVAEARQYAANRGVTLSAADNDVAAMLIKAVDYLEAQCCRYQGAKVDQNQALCWPRTGVYLGSAEFPSDAIPNSLKAAQNALVMAVNQGIDLLPNTTAADYVTEETVGPITTKFANPVAVGLSPNLNAAEALLAPLFGECRSYGGFTTVRV